MEAGADDFLVKPCDPAELRVRLREGERIIRLERTLRDQNRQLCEAQAALVQSEKLASVGQLAAGMAHEINNPIAYVTNNLTVLQREVHDLMNLLGLYRSSSSRLPETAPALARAVAEAEEECDLAWIYENLPHLFQSSLDGLARVRAIVQNLREFAHLDAAEYDRMDVTAALQATIDVLKHESDARQMEVRLDAETVSPILCHPAKIKQVLHSILLNAIQASHEHGRIDLRVRGEGDAVVIEVQDYGQGMDATTQHRAFEPFYTTRPVGSGQGLGLAISHRIVREHGGALTFVSRLGKGTTVRVELPAEPATLAPDLPLATAAPANT
jgi:signal transduction histidine kinase